MLTAPVFPRLRRRLLPAILTISAIVFTIAGTEYRMGELTTMGPGFFPVVLGIALTLLTLGVLREDWGRECTEPVLPWRPILAVVSGMLAWALLADRLGFIPASATQIALSAYALPGMSLKTLAWLIPALCGAGYLIFINQLGVPLGAF